MNAVDAIDQAITAGLPDVFLTYQQELWATVDHNALTVVEKSRRTGYSWALGAIAAATASATRQAGGQSVYYMGYDKEMSREFIGYVAAWSKSFQPIAAEVEDYVWEDPDHPEKFINTFRVKFASGFEVVALPSVARALRGKQGVVILDEAAFIDNLDETLKAALALLMWGGKVIVVSTHNSDTNPFNGLINDIRAGRRRGTVLRLTLDEAVAQGLYKRICLTQGKVWSPEAEATWVRELRETYGDSADEELDVIPSPSSGVYLPGPLLEARSTDDVAVLRYTAPPGMAMWEPHLREAEVRDWCERELLPVLERLDKNEQHFFGEDFGRHLDLTAMWLLALTRVMNRPTRLIIELRDVPYEQQKQILFYLLDRVPRLTKGLMDRGGNGDYLAEVAAQRYGTRIEGVQFSEGWYRENTPAWKDAIESAMTTLPRDVAVHSDFRLFKLIRGVARIADAVRINPKARRHGDTAIAHLLAYTATRLPWAEYDYQAVTAPKEGADRRYQDRADDFDDDDRKPGSGILPVLRGGMFG